MQISSVASLNARKSAELLVLPFWKEKNKAVVATSISGLSVDTDTPISLGDFSGNESEISFQYMKGEPEKRLLLLGLGTEKGITVEKLRRAFAAVTRFCQKYKIKTVNLLIPTSTNLSHDDLIHGVIEGMLLPNYGFHSLKKHKKEDEKSSCIQNITLIGADKTSLAIAKKLEVIFESVYMARDLVNGNADDITPQYLEAVARGLQKSHKKVKTTLLNKSKIINEGMGLLLAVNRGSTRDPAFIIVEYKGNPKSKEKTVLVGKGVTFDTGGLNLKSTGNMETMREDMAGAAAVLATIDAVASLDLKMNVTAVVPSTENGIDASSYKPGDVYVSYGGKSVEIGNTDAEGRLILADALAYAAEKLKPTQMISIATLTGAIEVTLGNEASGLMTPHDSLADLLAISGSETGERVWRLPMYEEYKDNLKSDVADIKSTGGRAASSINAATFLQYFVGDTSWAHLDIAGTAFLKENKRYLPKLATGVGVRLLLSFLEKI